MTSNSCLEFDCSRAILSYLVNKYGKDDNLYPKDPQKRALVDRMLYFDIGTLYKAMVDYFVSILACSLAHLIDVTFSILFIHVWLVQLERSRYSQSDVIWRVYVKQVPPVLLFVSLFCFYFSIGKNPWVEQFVSNPTDVYLMDLKNQRAEMNGHLLFCFTGRPANIRNELLVEV